MARQRIDHFDALVLRFYRAAREQSVEDMQEQVLLLLQRVLTFDSATWANSSDFDQRGIVVHGRPYLFREIPNRWVAYQEVKHQCWVAFSVAQNLGHTLNTHSPSLYRHRSQMGIREYAREVRHQNGLATALAGRMPGTFRWIGLYRAESDSQFTEEQRALCQRLVPHAMEAFDVNLALHSKLVQRGSYTAILASGGALEFVEPECVELIESEWPGSLKTLPPQACEALERVGGAPYFGRNIVVHVTRRGAFQILRCRRRQLGDSLTPRELRIAELVSAGFSYKEIAQLLHVAPSTVRNHIQNIHRRLGIHSNAQIALAMRPRSPQ